jgi:hypothetical protein
MRKAFSLRIVHCSKMSCCGRLGPAVPTKTSFPPVGSAGPADRCLPAGGVRTARASRPYHRIFPR